MTHRQRLLADGWVEEGPGVWRYRSRGVLIAIDREADRWLGRVFCERRHAGSVWRAVDLWQLARVLRHVATRPSAQGRQ